MLASEESCDDNCMRKIRGDGRRRYRDIESSTPDNPMKHSKAMSATFSAWRRKGY